MASGIRTLPVRSTLGQTMRTDAWWVQPLVVFLGLGFAIVYLTWAAIQRGVLHVRELPFAVVLARTLRGYASRAVRAQAEHLARVAPVVAGVPDSVGTRGLSRHLPWPT